MIQSQLIAKLLEFNIVDATIEMTKIVFCQTSINYRQ